MDESITPQPVATQCTRCGDQPKFTTSMLDPPTGRTFHMFECKCGDRSWVAEKIKTRSR